MFYHIDLETNNVIRPSGKDVSSMDQDSTHVTIKLYDKSKRVEKEWLKWLTYYGVTLPPYLKKEIWNVKFYSHGMVSRVKATDKKVVVFKSPVYVDKQKEFRLLARYPNYAVSKDGRLFDLRKNKIIPYSFISTETYIYPRVTVYDHCRDKAVTVLLHRLVALAWCANTDYMVRPIVNHKDRDRHNFHADNLEWVSYSGNTLHTLDYVPDYNVSYKIRNINTGIILTVASITAAAYIIGRSRINTVTSPFLKNRIWKGSNGEFELKLSTDTTPWFYEKAKVVRNNNITNKYIIKYHSGKTETYNYINELKDKYLDYKGHLAFEDLRNKILKINTEMSDIVQIETLNKHTGGYQAMNINTKEIFTANTNGALGKLIGLGKSTVTKAFALKDPNRVFINFVFRPYSEKLWEIDNLIVATNKPTEFNIIKNGKIVDTVRSTRELCSKYKLERHSILYHFKDNNSLELDSFIIKKII